MDADFEELKRDIIRTVDTATLDHDHLRGFAQNIQECKNQDELVNVLVICVMWLSRNLKVEKKPHPRKQEKALYRHREFVLQELDRRDHRYIYCAKANTMTKLLRILCMGAEDEK